MKKINGIVVGVLSCMLMLTGCGKKVATTTDFRSNFSMKKYKISKLDISQVPDYLNGADLNHVQVANKGENFVMFLDYEDEEKAQKGFKGYVQNFKEGLGNKIKVKDSEEDYWSGYNKEYDIASVASQSKNTVLIAMRGRSDKGSDLSKIEQVVEEFGYGK